MIFFKYEKHKLRVISNQDYIGLSNGRATTRLIQHYNTILSRYKLNYSGNIESKETAVSFRNDTVYPHELCNQKTHV